MTSQYLTHTASIAARSEISCAESGGTDTVGRPTLVDDEVEGLVEAFVVASVFEELVERVDFVGDAGTEGCAVVVGVFTAPDGAAADEDTTPDEATEPDEMPAETEGNGKAVPPGVSSALLDVATPL